MKKYFSDNELDWREYRFVQAATGGSDGVAQFVIGNARDWYGQALERSFDQSGEVYADHPGARSVEVPLISLETLQRDEESVDLLDMDIQGSEGEVIASSRRTLFDKVRRIHTGTHGAEVERLIYDTLRGDGWLCTAAYPAHAHSETPYGAIVFADGVQSWVNPRQFKKAP